MHAKEINIKNRVYNDYFDNLFKLKKLELKTLMRKTIKITTEVFTNCSQKVYKND